VTEQQFKRKNPDVQLRCGESHNKWWAEARGADGRYIGLRGKATLSEALRCLNYFWTLRFSNPPPGDRYRSAA
jgi:hypothetical protein